MFQGKFMKEVGKGLLFITALLVLAFAYLICKKYKPPTLSFHYTKEDYLPYWDKVAPNSKSIQGQWIKVQNNKADIEEQFQVVTFSSYHVGIFKKEIPIVYINTYQIQNDQTEKEAYAYTFYGNYICLHETLKELEGFIAYEPIRCETVFQQANGNLIVGNSVFQPTRTYSKRFVK